MKLVAKTFHLLAFIGAAGISLHAQGTAPATTGDGKLDEILARLTTIERRLSTLEGQQSISAPEAPPRATTDVSSVREIAARIEAIDEQVRIVDRKRELDQEAVATKLNPAPTVEAGRDGFSVRSADSGFQFKIGGYFQADSRFFVGPGQVDASTFVLRRIRPVLTGTLYKGIEFRLMPDWGLGTTVLQDLHLDFRFFPKASVRFGKFKTPFSLERLQSAAEMTFIERALPNDLAPNRDLGVQVYGDLKSGMISYAVAAMNGVPDGSSSDMDTNDGKDFVTRIFLQPFIRRGVTDKGYGLGLGVAASYGRQNGAILPTYKTTPQSVFFNFTNGTTADGERKRLGPQGHYYVGPFGVFAEYTVSEQDVRRNAATATLRNDAWQVAASYMLTGERKGYRAPTPRNGFDPSTGGRGAFEVSARYTELSVDKTAFQLEMADISRSARKAQEWTGGLTWYLARGNKFLLNYSQTHFTGGSATGNRPSEKVLLSRFQVAF